MQPNLVATAIHAGHALHPEIAALIALDEAIRMREEDPFTAQLARVAPTSSWSSPARRQPQPIIEAVSRDGYAIAQEYLPAAKEGDTRLFLMNGRPLEVNGKYAAFRRISAKSDARSNVQAGGRMAKAEITDEMLHIAEIVRPKLLHDGMFLGGLGIVGDKLMEINVFSPGGLGDAAKLEGENFPRAVIESLERKLTYRARSKGKLTNLQLAML